MIFLKKELGGTQGELTTPVLPRPEGAGRGAAVCNMSTGKRLHNIWTGCRFTPRKRLSLRMTEYAQVPHVLPNSIPTPFALTPVHSGSLLGRRNNLYLSAGVS